MLTLDPKFAGVGGSPDAIAVVGPATDGGGLAPASGAFAGTEPLSCVVWPGGTSPPVAWPPVAWGDDAGSFDPDKPVLTVSWPPATVAALSPGWWRGRVSLADMSANLAEFRVQVLDGPDAAATSPRAALHSYADLRFECPWIERLQEDVDQAGFAAAGAEARDWIEQRAAASVSEVWQPTRPAVAWPWAWGVLYQPYVPPAPIRKDYEAAIAATGLDLSGTNGRLIVKASVHYALSMIFRRAVGAPNPPVDLTDGSKFHESKAVETLNRAEVRVGDLPPIRFGDVAVGRLRR